MSEKRALSDEASQEGNPILILAIDDEQSFLDLIKTYLEQFFDDITVRTETNPTEVPDRLNEEPIDCVVSDYDMPQMNGIELHGKIQDQYPNLPFVLFTGKGSEEIATDAIQAGVTDYIQKGAGGKEVFELLNNSIDNAVAHRRAERRARVSRDRLLSHFDNIDGFFIVDKDWRVKYWNTRIAKRTGKSSEEVLDTSVWEVYNGEDSEEMRANFEKSMEEDVSIEFRTQYDSRWLDVSVEPFEDDLFVHSRDVTEQIHNQQQLYQRNERLQQFLSTVRHDLKTPLTIAEGRLQLTKDTGDPNHLDEAEDALGRMSILIDDLLKIAGGQKDLDITKVSLHDVTMNAWELTDTDGSVEVGNDVTFEADPGPLRQLLVNLFRNVQQHAGAGASIWIGGKEDGFYVEDDGTGIEEKDRENVMKPGVSTGNKNEGLGLGIVQLVVDVHGWDIKVTEGVRSGARFEVTGMETDATPV